KMPVEKGGFHPALVWLEVVGKGEVALVPVAEGAVGGGVITALVLCRLPPGVPFADGVGKVALKNLCQVMGAEKLVVVGQADKGIDCVLNGHMQLLCPTRACQSCSRVNTAMIWIKGTGSMVRVSRTQFW